MAPLAQDLTARQPLAHEGDLLDTRTACLPLTAEEEGRYSELVAAAKSAAKPEVEGPSRRRPRRSPRPAGIALDKARAVVAASTQGRTVVVGRTRVR